MAVVHMTEAELVNNIADVMRQVRQGSEIVIEPGNRPVAVIKPSKPAGRMISWPGRHSPTSTGGQPHFPLR